MMKGEFPIFETFLGKDSPRAPYRLTPPALACEPPKLKISSDVTDMPSEKKKRELVILFELWRGCMVIVTRAKLGSRP